MAGLHHWLEGRGSEWTPGVGDGQGGLACCDSWGRKESDTTEQLIWSDLILKVPIASPTETKFVQSASGKYLALADSLNIFCPCLFYQSLDCSLPLPPKDTLYPAHMGYLGFTGGASGKEPAHQCRRYETWVWSFGWEDPLEKGMATHSSVLDWRIPWTEEPGKLKSTGSQRWTRLQWLSTRARLSLCTGSEGELLTAACSPGAQVWHCGLLFGTLL